ncbi:hypothetical protein KUCAC02_028982, partial [Chaenocephalus aceratus]
LAVAEQHRHSQSGPEVSGSYFLERDYQPLLLGGTRPPGLNSSATRRTRCRKQTDYGTCRMGKGAFPPFTLELCPAMLNPPAFISSPGHHLVSPSDRCRSLKGTVRGCSNYSTPSTPSSPKALTR